MIELDLWGSLTIDENLQTPKTILLAQAALLRKKTNNMLNADVDHRGGFQFDFNILAPKMEYTQTVLTVKSSIMMYPLQIDSPVTNETYQCKNEEEFLTAVRGILQSAIVRRVVLSLFANSKSEK